MMPGLCVHCRNERLVGTDGHCLQCAAYLRMRRDRPKAKTMTPAEREQLVDDLFGPR